MHILNIRETILKIRAF